MWHMVNEVIILLLGNEKQDGVHGKQLWWWLEEWTVIFRRYCNLLIKYTHKNMQLYCVLPSAKFNGYACLNYVVTRSLHWVFRAVKILAHCKMYKIMDDMDLTLGEMQTRSLKGFLLTWNLDEIQRREWRQHVRIKRHPPSLFFNNNNNTLSRTTPPSVMSSGATYVAIS